MKPFLLSVFAFSFTLLQAQVKPKLVVGVVVDQMRYDYLTRYASDYGSGGFNRLMSENGSS
jgi:predicted AlkP superfamily pyrophosphatase or phosphodiesterase